MSDLTIGFIGLGEVGSIFAQMVLHSGARVLGYDALIEREEAATIRERLSTDKIALASLEEAVTSADYVLSTVTTQVAIEVARDCVPYLSPGQTYIDMNSTSPAVKVELAGVIEETGADFVEGAILGAVGATGAATQVLLTGAQADTAAATLNKYGLNCAVFGQNIGDAASFKMLRSVFSKGIEALLLEMLVAARRANIQPALWEEIVDFMTSNPFENVASNWIVSHVAAYERRYHEMVQVVKTLRELGVDPVMSEATLAFFERSRELGLDEAFGSKPDDPVAVIASFDRQLETPAPTGGS